MSEPERERLSVAQPPSNSMGAVKRVIKAYKSRTLKNVAKTTRKRLFKGPDTPSTGFMAVIFALHMFGTCVCVRIQEAVETVPVFPDARETFRSARFHR